MTKCSVARQKKFFPTHDVETHVVDDDQEHHVGEGLGAVFPAVADQSIPWVPEVFLACGGNFRCWPKAETSSAVGRSHERRSREKRLDRNRKPR